MGMINCPDCSEAISDSAPSCPKCGRPSPALSLQQIKGQEVIGCFGVLLLIWLANAFLALVIKGFVKGVLALMIGPLVWMF
jgi:hypothetical protein